MDIFFHDPTDIPLPPGEVRIRKFKAEPWPDRQRVKLILELTPFLQRPNGEIAITDGRGVEAASLDIIETMVTRMEFTMHLRGPELVGPFIAVARIFYLGEPETPSEDPQEELESRPRTFVDKAEVSFDIHG